MQDNFTDSNKNDSSNDPATDVIRSKLDAIYAKEPPASKEMAEIKQHGGHHLSKHQRYMRDLGMSGRSLAEIQTAWHTYYENLPDREKHEVWNEFYKESRSAKTAHPHESQAVPASPQHASTDHPTRQPHKPNLKKDLIRQATGGTASKKQHLKALMFGLSMGSLVIFGLLFSFFNERFITPFIKPSYNITSTPIITEPGTSGKVGPEPKIIIPKINLEAPVVYDQPSVEEKAVQGSLEKGVLHYATTSSPGEVGNAVIFGHSSSNIFNSGKYKFAFLLLKSVEKGDTFMLHKDGKRYVYKVYDKYVTSPSNLEVLKPQNRKSTVTLITCDPPGTSTNRLIVVAEQIFPSPDKNKPSTAEKGNQQPTELASNPPSLWSRLWDWL